MDRKVVVSTKVDRVERAKMELLAAKHGVSVCAWLRQLVVEATSVVREDSRS